MNTEDRVKEFLLSCIDQTEVVHGNKNSSNIHHLMILQLCGKVFELEDRVKELENERK